MRVPTIITASDVLGEAPSAGSVCLSCSRLGHVVPVTPAETPGALSFQKGPASAEMQFGHRGAGVDEVPDDVCELVEHYGRRVRTDARTDEAHEGGLSVDVSLDAGLSVGNTRALRGSRDVGSLTFSERTGVSEMQFGHRADGVTGLPDDVQAPDRHCAAASADDSHPMGRRCGDFES